MCKFTLNQLLPTRLAIFWLLLLPAMSMALPNDQSQPIHIKSDTAEIDDAKGISIYRGKVIIKQGTLHLTADTVTIYNKGKSISRLVAVGNPAHYKQQQKDNESLTHAFGKKIEYLLANERIIITDNARLEQEQNSFAGDRIDYDIKQKIVNAYSDNKSSQGKPSRVEMVIQPNNSPLDSEINNTNE